MLAYECAAYQRLPLQLNVLRLHKINCIVYIVSVGGLHITSRRHALCQGYLLVLASGQPTLLGLAYLALLLALFVAPPLRGTYRALDNMGRSVDACDSAVSGILHARLSPIGELGTITVITSAMSGFPFTGLQRMSDLCIHPRKPTREVKPFL